MRRFSIFFRSVDVRRRPFFSWAIFRAGSAYALTRVSRIRLRASLCRRWLHRRRHGRPIAKGRYVRRFALLALPIRALASPMRSRAYRAYGSARRYVAGGSIRAAMVALSPRGDTCDVSRYWLCQYALWLRLCARVRLAHTGSARRYVAGGSIRAAMVGFCFAIRRPFGEIQAPKKAPNPRTTPIVALDLKPVGAMGGTKRKKIKKNI